MTADGRRGRQPDEARQRGRANDERSIYPYRNEGYAAHVTDPGPTDEAARTYVHGKTHEIVHDKWVKDHATASDAPIPTATPTVAQYLARWLADVVEPNLEPATYAYYETMARLYIIPALGNKRLDGLQTREVQTWLNKLASDVPVLRSGQGRRAAAGPPALLRDRGVLRRARGPPHRSGGP